MSNVPIPQPGEEAPEDADGRETPDGLSVDDDGNAELDPQELSPEEVMGAD